MSIGTRPVPQSETEAERRVDDAVQTINVILAVTGCIVLGTLAGHGTDPARLMAVAAYGAGLLAMVMCSALYGRGRHSLRRWRYRALDQAAIFVMIAGTYTPFVVVYAPTGQRVALLAVIWTAAMAGILLRLAAPSRFEPFVVLFYLLMGWAVAIDPSLLLRLPHVTAILLAAGGALYTAGVAFHLSRMRFQEAIWHCFVAAAAACHYAAVLITVFHA
jgi:hemolysin III